MHNQGDTSDTGLFVFCAIPQHMVLTHYPSQTEDKNHSFGLRFEDPDIWEGKGWQQNYLAVPEMNGS